MMKTNTRKPEARDALGDAVSRIRDLPLLAETVEAHLQLYRSCIYRRVREARASKRKRIKR